MADAMHVANIPRNAMKPMMMLPSTLMSASVQCCILLNGATQTELLSVADGGMSADKAQNRNAKLTMHAQAQVGNDVNRNAAI